MDHSNELCGENLLKKVNIRSSARTYDRYIDQVWNVELTDFNG